MMRLGVVFPQTEIGPDPDLVRTYAQAVEQMGYQHLVFYDHVLGASPERPEKLNGPYTHLDQFHEVFVVMGYLAACTTDLELVCEVLVLPQRQTALVAKQAAEVATLSRGRLRLGVGIGWNHVEYESLGQSFHDRGNRIEEQVELLRQLWSEPVTRFDGRYHQVRDAGINPLPPLGRIPLWMGGTADVVLRRAARLADGWMTQERPGSGFEEAWDKVRGYLKDNGRDPQDFGVAARITLKPDDTHTSIGHGVQWRQCGATHLSLNTMGLGLGALDEHLELLRSFKQAWDGQTGGQ